MKIAVYPGTFDPITNGHLDIVQRASRIFDRIILAIAENPRKHPLFSLDERKRLAEEAVTGIANVNVETFGGLLVHYAKNRNATAILRGLRAVSDFDYEFQMALLNRKLAPDLETVYLMPSEEYSYINSSIVKEVAHLGGRLDCFIPKPVADALRDKVDAAARTGRKRDESF
jgi:pantetheine-phosphate adenylyltransferase